MKGWSLFLGGHIWQGL